MPNTTGSTADFLRSFTSDDDIGDVDRSTEVEVLEENWAAVMVFKRCRQEWAMHMAGATAMGLSALEVRAGCELAGIPQAQWDEVSEQVQEMGAIAAEALNQRTS